MGIIGKLKLLWNVRKLWRLVMSKIGDANQARIAAEHANQKVPIGTVLVTPAKAPLKSALVETGAAAASTGIAGVLAVILHLLVPSLDAEELAAIGTVVALIINFGFKLYRKGTENATAPGVQDGK